MITTKLTGRLGDITLEIFNLFQYAQCKSIPFDQIILNKRYDATAYKRGNYKRLKFFQTDNYIERNKEWFTNIIDTFVDNETYLNNVKALKKVDFNTAYDSNEISNDVFLINNLPIPKNICKEQSLQLFKKLFSNDSIMMRNRLIYSDISERVAIHIRRTDYADFCNGKYLLSSKQVNKTIAQYKFCGYDKFIVFSDDISWCKNNISDCYDIIFHLPQKYDYDDLVLMSFCKEIFANNGHSKFSECAKILHDTLQ